MMLEDEVFAGLRFLSRHAPPEYRPAIEMALSACRVVKDACALDKLRARPAADLEISVRAGNALAHLNLETIGDVEKFMNLDEDVILERGKHFQFRKKCLKEVRLLLKSIGLEPRRNAVTGE
jgi:hypothetical protein